LKLISQIGTSTLSETEENSAGEDSGDKEGTCRKSDKVEETGFDWSRTREKREKVEETGFDWPKTRKRVEKTCLACSDRKITCLIGDKIETGEITVRKKNGH